MDKELIKMGLVVRHRLTGGKLIVVRIATHREGWVQCRDASMDLRWFRIEELEDVVKPYST